MEKTKNYSMFKIIEENRKIDPLNLKKIVTSIQSKNLLHLRPILVSKDFEIFDGQHRLEAAKQLGIEIYYDIKENLEVDDIYALNSAQKNWTSEDYLNFYVAKGKSQYIKFAEFQKRNGVRFNIAHSLLFANKMGGDRYAKFCNGTFLYPDTDKIDHAEMVIRLLKEIDSLYRRRSGEYVGINTLALCRAVNAISLMEGFNEHTLLDRINRHYEKFYRATTISGWINMLKNIYNYRLQSKIGIAGDDE